MRKCVHHHPVRNGLSTGTFLFKGMRFRDEGAALTEAEAVAHALHLAQPRNVDRTAR